MVKRVYNKNAILEPVRVEGRFPEIADLETNWKHERQNARLRKEVVVPQNFTETIFTVFEVMGVGFMRLVLGNKSQERRTNNKNTKGKKRKEGVKLYVLFHTLENKIFI